MGGAEARELAGSVVVITGASSGIGRAAALRLARRHARLVLAARSSAALDAVARECVAAGAEVETDVVDVADEAQVRGLAEIARGRFGGIDVWVNGAAVMSYGRFEEVPSEVFRRIIETNLLGQVHGARAALEVFRATGGGTLINVSSVWGRVTSPQVSAYVTSKHAVRAFSECLRFELADSEGIEVATILPQAVDTPIFDHAANYSGRRIRPIPPIEDPDEIAKGIERCASDPKREVTYGRAGRLLEVLYALSPAIYTRVAPLMFTRGTFAELPAPSGPGNVLGSAAPHRIDGEWRRGRSVPLRRALLAALAGGLAGMLGKRT